MNKNENVKSKMKMKKWPLLFILMSFIVPVTMGHYLYKNNYLFELGNVSHGKILSQKVYVEINKKRIYKWSILHIAGKGEKYINLKNQQVFYNSKLLLNKNKKKIDNIYTGLKNISIEKKKINNNILKEGSYLIIDPNSNIIIQYKSSTNLKHIISDIKRLLQYARF